MPVSDRHRFTEREMAAHRFAMRAVIAYRKAKGRGSWVDASHPEYDALGRRVESRREELRCR